ncbi:MAG: hypothetical protein UHG91_07255 [Succinivibrionaceae bacterium]|nr:hypothetical protein [Succinivibrionaceae bacterium]
MRKCNFPVDIEELLPHKEPTLLIDTVENATENTIVCKITVGNRKASAYTEDNELPVISSLEIMAQTLSAWYNYNFTRANKPLRFGILVKIKRLVLTRNGDLPEGMHLKVSAVFEPLERGYIICTCDIKDELENEIIANARLLGIVPNDNQINDMLKQAEMSRL